MGINNGRNKEGGNKWGRATEARGEREPQRIEAQREAGRGGEPEGGLAGCQRSVVLHLCLRDDGFLPWIGAEEGGERGCNHKRVRPDEATQVAARDRVLFCLKHQSVHSIKLAPGQPHGALLAQEGGTLKSQSQRSTTVSYQVKPGEGGNEVQMESAAVDGLTQHFSSSKALFTAQQNHLKQIGQHYFTLMVQPTCLDSG